MTKLTNAYNLQSIYLLYQSICTFKDSKIPKHIYKLFTNLNNSNQSF